MTDDPQNPQQRPVPLGDNAGGPYRTPGEPTPVRPRRRPVPTSVPGGSAEVNRWIYEWSQERIALEWAEDQLAARDAEIARLDAGRTSCHDSWMAAEVAATREMNRANDAEARVAQLEAALRSARGSFRAIAEQPGDEADGDISEKAMITIDLALEGAQ